MGSRFMASRMRCSMNHADFGGQVVLALDLAGEMPFLLAAISKMTRTHVRTGILVPWKMVPVRTENCLRQSAHFHTRRCRSGAGARLASSPFCGVQEVRA